MKRDINLTCRHCLRSYNEDGQDYGNYNTGLCFGCFEEDQATQTSSGALQQRRLKFLYS